MNQDRELEIRGDLIIQALLTETAPRDASNQPRVNWLDADQMHSRAAYPRPRKRYPLAGPPVLLSRSSAPGQPTFYTHELQVLQGPLHGPLFSYRQYDDISPTFHPVSQYTVQFALSQPGIPQNGAVPPIISPLEVAPLGHVKRVGWRHISDARAPERLDVPPNLDNKVARIIDPQQYYRIDEETGGSGGWRLTWSWRGTGKQETFSFTFQPHVTNDYKNRLSKFMTCFHFRPNSDDLFQNELGTRYDLEKPTRQCNTWEIPAGWTSGQPLKLVEQRYREYFPTYLDEQPSYDWNDHNHVAAPTRESLNTTAEPISNYGISGAVLAAMFDAFTPRGQGMWSLPQRAGFSTEPSRNPPEAIAPFDAFVGLFHESHASTYADGSTDTSRYSPATGNYLYTLVAGGWKSITEPVAGTASVPQYTLALHVNNDLQKGFTLPRWVGTRIVEHNGTTDMAEYESADGRTRTIAPSALIMFGQEVQSWPLQEPAKRKNPYQGRLRLSVEQHTQQPRSADLCWTLTDAKWWRTAKKFCTTWSIPAGWQPGQVLKPESYYVLRDIPLESSRTTETWNTRAAH